MYNNFIIDYLWAKTDICLHCRTDKPCICYRCIKDNTPCDCVQRLHAQNILTQMNGPHNKIQLRNKISRLRSGKFYKVS